MPGTWTSLWSAQPSWNTPSRNSRHLTSVTSVEKSSGTAWHLPSTSTSTPGRSPGALSVEGPSARSPLIQHQRTHTGEKPCEGRDCGLPAERPPHQHLQIHTGEKPCKCRDCGKAFNRSFSLTKHQRIHTGKQPYACCECRKAFTQVTQLVQHQRTHTGEQPYECG